MVVESRGIQELRRLIEKFRESSANVVIFGETGCGKEVVARQLRGRSPDGSLAPFVSVDSATIQGSTAESVLFGHEKGAFTGAERLSKGVFEEADRGIVYFDEIANMPLDIQAKLLRVIQEKEITRLGSTKTIRLDFRVICATNRELEEMTGQGQFKEDLLQRLNVLPIRIPPLRERSEDIPLLVSHFLRRSIDRLGFEFTDEAIAALQNYQWPGNVRELINVITFTTTMAERELIDLADLPPRIREGGSKTRAQGTFYDQVANFEKAILAQAYSGCGGNISKLALSLGMDRSHLYTKLREHELHPARK